MDGHLSTSTDADLAGYFGRIGYSGPGDPTPATLRALIAAHTRTIPFENLDPLLGRPVDNLDPAALAAKLVRHRRGGYCFEHNGLMADVLARLGFAVDKLGARVVWGAPPGALQSGPLPAQTHQLLAVTVPGVPGRMLVDVGFGGQTPTSPLQLQTDTVQPTDHEPYRLRTHRDGYLLEAQIRGEWTALYLFADRPQPPIDARVASWYVSTHPASKFVSGLTAAIVTDDARVNLRGRHLTIHQGDGSEVIRFDTAAQVLDVLVDRFGIELPAGVDLEARVHEVLDD